MATLTQEQPRREPTVVEQLSRLLGERDFRTIIHQASDVLQSAGREVQPRVLQEFTAAFVRDLSTPVAHHGHMLPKFLTMEQSDRLNLLRRFTLVVTAGAEHREKYLESVFTELGASIKTAVDSATTSFCTVDTPQEKRATYKEVLVMGTKAARAVYAVLQSDMSAASKEAFERLWRPSINDIKSAEAGVPVAATRCITFKGIFDGSECGTLSQAALDILAGSPRRDLRTRIAQRRGIGPVVGKVLRFLALPRLEALD